MGREEKQAKERSSLENSKCATWKEGRACKPIYSRFGSYVKTAYRTWEIGWNVFGIRCCRGQPDDLAGIKPIQSLDLFLHRVSFSPFAPSISFPFGARVLLFSIPPCQDLSLLIDDEKKRKSKHISIFHRVGLWISLGRRGEDVKF